MQTKKINFTIDPSLPVFIDSTLGNITVIFDNSSYAELEYPEFGNIEPEIKIKTEEKNIVSISNIMEENSGIIFHFPAGTGGLEIISNNGDISVYNASSITHLQNFNGDIIIGDTKGDLTLESYKGNTKINSFSGKLTVNSSNGSILALNCELAGGLIESITGSIIIGLTGLNDSLRITSKYSKIAAGLGAKCSVEITARGRNVINYINKQAGEYIGSPAEINFNGNKAKLEIFSAGDNVLLSKIEDLDRISPDMQKIFEEFDAEFYKAFKSFSKKLGSKGDKLIDNLKKSITSFFKNESTENGNAADKGSLERMEILKMLKEGKISAEEAERLLKALK
jgi:hypothetical protein